MLLGKQKIFPGDGHGHIPAFTTDDAQALRFALPPEHEEPWRKYLDRAKEVGLVTQEEIDHIRQEFGVWALEAYVIPIILP